MSRTSKYLRSRIARRLNMESLEQRRYLDATMEMIGDTLFIRGSMQADEIVIVDHGYGRISASNSTYHGGRTEAFTDVAHVRVQSDKGDDSVRYSMPDPGHGVLDIEISTGPQGNNQVLFEAGPRSADDWREHHLTIIGGANNDRVTLDFSRGASIWAIRSELGGGEDQLMANFTNPGSLVGFNPQPDPPAIDGEIIPCVRVAVSGGDGDDNVAIDQRRFGGEFDLVVDLGAGQDHVRVLADPPLKHFSATLRGGEGNDALEMIFSQIGEARGESLVRILGDAGEDSLLLDAGSLSPANLRAQLDGGAGFDRARVPRFASVANVESLSIH